MGKFATKAARANRLGLVLVVAAISSCAEPPPRLVCMGPEPLREVCLALATSYQSHGTNLEIQFQSGGSGRGLKRLAEGTASLVLLRRPVQERERSIVTETATITRERTIARAGLQFLGHCDNPLTSLRRSMLRSVLTSPKATRTWGELGAPPPAANAPIELMLQRAALTHSALNHLLGEAPSPDLLAAPQLETATAVLDWCARRPNALGITLPVNPGEVREPIDSMATMTTVRNLPIRDDTGQRTMLSHPVLVIATSPSAALFVDWIHTPAGRRVLTRHGLEPTPP